MLNNDVEAIGDGWLDALVEKALEAEIGCVGALLLYPNGSIQHAGIVLGFGGIADHVYSGLSPKTVQSCFVTPDVGREVSANTGACLAIRRSVFDELGGFDEALQVTGDLDLCIRAMRLGYQNFFCSDVCLTHHESVTRKRGIPKQESDEIRRRLRVEIEAGDRFFNPNLSLSSRMPIPNVFSAEYHRPLIR
jgi:GT2 family glycosyltransferase